MKFITMQMIIASFRLLFLKEAFDHMAFLGGNCLIILFFLELWDKIICILTCEI